MGGEDNVVGAIGMLHGDGGLNGAGAVNSGSDIVFVFAGSQGQKDGQEVYFWSHKVVSVM
jgi:hypothetical protein